MYQKRDRKLMKLYQKRGERKEGEKQKTDTFLLVAPGYDFPPIRDFSLPNFRDFFPF